VDQKEKIIQENGTENGDEKVSTEAGDPDQKQNFPIYPNGERN
jgi:hypothetical protein